MKPQSRISNPQYIDRKLIDKELKAGKQVIVQFSEALYTDVILAELNELCAQYDEQFSIRFFGHYQGSFDLDTLLKLPNIKGLWLDCLMQSDHLEALRALKHLRLLSLGIYELQDTEILQAENLRQLKILSLGDTKTKALNLQYLADYTALKELGICGHTKNIEALGQLTQLEYLGLNAISKVKLNFVNKLKNLKSLHLVLGSRENLDEIEDNEIETLEINRVRSFNSFTNSSKFKKLKNLIIEDQIQLTELSLQAEDSELMELKIINCKSLHSLTKIGQLNRLKKLIIFKTALNFDEFIEQHFPAALQVLAFYTSRKKEDLIIKERLLQLGYREEHS